MGRPPKGQDCIEDVRHTRSAIHPLPCAHPLAHAAARPPRVFSLQSSVGLCATERVEVRAIWCQTTNSSAADDVEQHHHMQRLGDHRVHVDGVPCGGDCLLDWHSHTVSPLPRPRPSGELYLRQGAVGQASALLAPFGYHRGKFLERDKFDVDKFGSPTSYQIFPSILRMRCVKGQPPSRGHQEITAAIHYEATARDLVPKFSFISKDQFQIPPPLILALPKKNPLKLFPRWYSAENTAAWPMISSVFFPSVCKQAASAQIRSRRRRKQFCASSCARVEQTSSGQLASQVPSGGVGFGWVGHRPKTKTFVYLKPTSNFGPL